ncbi:hypothetical protein T02_2669 [Trichinella nativa]|uniref:Uncharacterized protein n=1 Tax=Trichinella nativa TaxID=6335 RepID=A0A0V1L445_9BILA|nr:hypothetical protein T02_2669 [Trichinella nativa]
MKIADLDSDARECPLHCSAEKILDSFHVYNSHTSAVMKLICLFALVIATSAFSIQKQTASKKNYNFKAEKEAVIAELDQRFDGYREHCYPLPGDGCRCQEIVQNAKVSKEYKTDFECKTDEKRQRLCEDAKCKTQFQKINRCRTQEKCGQEKWTPYETCLKECMKIQYFTFFFLTPSVTFMKLITDRCIVTFKRSNRAFAHQLIQTSTSSKSKKTRLDIRHDTLTKVINTDQERRTRQSLNVSTLPTSKRSKSCNYTSLPTTELYTSLY